MKKKKVEEPKKIRHVRMAEKPLLELILELLGS